MPICIECRYPVPQLYHVLHSGAHNPSSKTPRVDKSSNTPSGTGAGTKAIPVGGQKSAGTSVGGDVRLTQCPRCKKFADKYVEHDFVVLFIDLVLVKPQVRDLHKHAAEDVPCVQWSNDHKSKVLCCF